MRLSLVQHGQAVPEEEDPDRPLTAKGRADVRAVAEQAVGALGVRPDRIVHSGRTRARQTAEIWGELTGVEPEPADGLAPKDDPAGWAARVNGEDDGLVLVGHLPHLALLTSLLVVGEVDRPVVAFRPGGLVVLHRTEGWRVETVLPPAAQSC